MASEAQIDLQDGKNIWPSLALRLGGESRLIAAFTLCYLPLVWLSYQFKTGPLQISLMWPAVGLLLAVLTVAPLRRWPALILLQLICEYAIALAVREPSLPFGLIWFMLANTANGVVGALVARLPLWRAPRVRATQIVQMLAAALSGAAVSATLGAAIAVYSYGATSYPFQWQVWLFSNLLGSLVVGPAVIFWSIPGRRAYEALKLANRWELPLFAAAIALSIWWTFGVPRPPVDSLLRSPTVTLALLVWAAFRVPPRWSALLTLGALLLIAGIVTADRGPMSSPAAYSQTLRLQAFLALLAAVTLIVSILVAAMRIALEEISTSEGRYRNLITLSSEAVWRVEIDPPMPVALALEPQREWLREHARVAESNGVFDKLAVACSEPGEHGPQWSSSRSWCALFEQNLEQGARSGFVLDGLRLVANIGGQSRSLIVGFAGVVANDRLQRIWCMARDVTELVDLNARLLRERERLKAYANQVMSAEERGRRATAVELHDGIGQTLTGMAMSLEVARMQAPQVSPLLDDVRTNLRRVQDRTRDLIAELSPPGLYELGLSPALQWLVVHFRSQEKFRVVLDCQVNENAIPMELRVLLFKLVRELLRNVVKHAGVSEAHVLVRGDRERIRAEVEDTGRGFEWQMEMFGPRPGAYGLWSIADRVADAGGEFSVDAAPGQGSRFKLEFPLAR